MIGGQFNFVNLEITDLYHSMGRQNFVFPENLSTVFAACDNWVLLESLGMLYADKYPGLESSGFSCQIKLLINHFL